MNIIDFKLAVELEEEIDEEKINIFINAFNVSISKKRMSLNTGLDSIQQLNNKELDIVNKQCNKIGYSITTFGDNYNTISYKMSKNRPIIETTILI